MGTRWYRLPGRSELVAGGRLVAVLVAATLVVGVESCGVPERDNRLEPFNANAAAADLLVGTWSRADAEANEVYTFRADGRVELVSYASPGGGAVDRNAASTVLITYGGIYVLRGNLLRLTLTTAQTTEPGGIPPALPPDDRVVVIEVGARQLSMSGSDGRHDYVRM